MRAKPAVRDQGEGFAMKTKILGVVAALAISAVVSPAFSIEVGFVYSGGTFNDLAVPGSTYTNPSGINNAGQIVGYYLGGRPHTRMASYTAMAAIRPSTSREATLPISKVSTTPARSSLMLTLYQT
jgi:hypothetical protein